MQEVGHIVAAFPKKVKLSIPYFIPNITLGSFGAITQVSICYCPCREIMIMEIVNGTNFLLTIHSFSLNLFFRTGQPKLTYHLRAHLLVQHCLSQCLL